MRNANVEFSNRDGKGYEVAKAYAERLPFFGFNLLDTHPRGGAVYYNNELELSVCVYVS